jgi:hypothetical protein
MYIIEHCVFARINTYYEAFELVSNLISLLRKVIYKSTQTISVFSCTTIEKEYLIIQS